MVSLFFIAAAFAASSATAQTPSINFDEPGFNSWLEDGAAWKVDPGTLTDVQPRGESKGCWEVMPERDDLFLEGDNDMNVTRLYLRAKNPGSVIKFIGWVDGVRVSSGQYTTTSTGEYEAVTLNWPRVDHILVSHRAGRGDVCVDDVFYVFREPNRAPALRPLTQAHEIIEDSAGLDLDNITATDRDSDSVTVTMTLSDADAGELTADSGNGEVFSGGVWRITADLGSVNQALSGVVFKPAANWDQDVTIAVGIVDQYGLAGEDGSISIDITPVNDLPTSTSRTFTVSYIEDESPVAITDIVVSDVDTGAQVIATLSLSAKIGDLTADSGNGETFNGDTGVWTVTGSLSEVNAALADVSFEPFQDNDTDATIAVTIANTGRVPPGGLLRGLITLDVQPQNDDPTATNMTQTLGYTEGDESVAIEDIVVSDPDRNERFVVALRLRNRSTGSLSGDGGTYSDATGVWRATGTLSQVNTALAAVAFIPASDNDVNAVIDTAVADDDGARAEGGEISLNVTGVNDPPTARLFFEPVSYTEDDASVDLENVVVEDVDTDDEITVRLTLADHNAGILSTSGTATFKDGVWEVVGSVDQVNTALRLVAFEPATDYDVDTSITVRVSDKAGTGPRPGIITLDVTAVNDLPTATRRNQEIEYSEGTRSVALGDIVVSDPDTSDEWTATLTLDDPTTGALSANDRATYSDDTGVWTISGSLNAVNSALEGVTFLPDTQNDRDSNIAVHIVDRAAEEPAAGTIKLTVVPENDPPTAENLSGTVNYTEGAISVNLPDISVADPDTSDTITAELTLTPASIGRLTGRLGSINSDESGVLTVTGTPSVVTTILASVRFLPTTNNDLDGEISTVIRDAAGTGPESGTIQLIVEPVNDPPTATNMSGEPTYIEGAEEVELDDIVVADVDTDDVLSATITVDEPTRGELSTAGGGSYERGVWSFTGSLHEINVALAALSFLPETDNDQTVTLTVHIEDKAGTGPDDGEIILTVRSSNDPPSATNLNQTQEYVEGTETVETTDMVVSDADTDERISLYFVNPNEDAGSLSSSAGRYRSGIWTYSGSVSEANAALADLVFKPAQDNDQVVSIGALVVDSVGASRRGTITFNVTPVNDAPTAENHNQEHTYDEGSGVTLEPITVADPDTDDIITVTFTLSDRNLGTIRGASEETGVLTASGSVLEVNALIASVVFEPAEDNDMNGSIAVHITDRAGTGPRDGLISLNVDPDNDGPSATNLDQTITFDEDAASADLADIVVTDPDTGDEIAVAISNVASGRFSDHADSSWDRGRKVWSTSGTVAEVNDVLSQLAYIPAENYDGSFEATVTVRDRSIVQAGTLTFVAVPKNDAPTATNLEQTLPYEEGTRAVAIGDIAVSDVDSSDIITAQLTLRDPSYGSLTSDFYDPETGILKLTGTPARVTSLLESLTFAPDSRNDRDTQIVVAIRDQAGAGPDGLIILDVTGTNQPPTITRWPVRTVFPEDARSVSLTDAVVTDPDTDDTVTLTLSLADPAAGVLTIDESDGATLSDEGVWSFTGSPGALTTALAGATFIPTRNWDTPTTLTLHLEDAAGTGPEDIRSELYPTPANDVVSATNTHQTISYSEGDETVEIEPIVVSDPDSNETISVIVTLADPTVGDFSADSGSGESYSSDSGVWSVTGSVTVVNTALVDLTFLPKAENEENVDASVLIRDSADTGPPQGRLRFDVAGVNDAPVLVAGNSITYTEEDSPVLVSEGLALTDIDGPNIVSASVSITEGFEFGEDVLALASVRGISGEYESLTGVLTLTGDGDAEAYQTALRAVTYANTNTANPSTADRVVSFTVNDGNEVSDTATILVVGENDAPIIDLEQPAESLVAVEGTELAFTVTATDPDEDDLFYRVTGLPGHATQNADTGEVAWTPVYQEAKVWELTLFASDGLLEVSRVVSVTVSYLDGDDDGAGDGLPDTWEVENNLDPTTSDSDGDTISDLEEVGRLDSPRNSDEDDLLDALDLDSDEDGQPDSVEAGDDDLLTAAVDSDEDGWPDYRDRDSDDDDVEDDTDNCRVTENSQQDDLDEDGEGDACDLDIDGDGLLNDDEIAWELDPMNVDSDLDNISDGEEVGDILEPFDSDDDGEIDALELDSDDDGIDDIDEAGDDSLDTEAVDTDDDGTPDYRDTDSDGDTIEDDTDNCRLVENTDQLDTDDNSEGDACDNDADGDDVENSEDNCELIANPEQEDFDEDDIGDVCDGDIDGDGVDNLGDNCELIANPEQEDQDTDGIGDSCDEEDPGTGLVTSVEDELEEDGVDGGCSCNLATSDRDAAGWLLLLIPGALLLRRRRPTRS